jgi:hypothetical protein
MTAVEMEQRARGPSSESRQGTNPREKVRGRRSALSYGDLGDAEGACDDRNALEGEQWRAWWEAEAGVGRCGWLR